MTIQDFLLLMDVLGEERPGLTLEVVTSSMRELGTIEAPLSRAMKDLDALYEVWPEMANVILEEPLNKPNVARANEILAAEEAR